MGLEKVTDNMDAFDEMLKRLDSDPNDELDNNSQRKKETKLNTPKTSGLAPIENYRNEQVQEIDVQGEVSSHLAAKKLSRETRDAVAKSQEGNSLMSGSNMAKGASALQLASTFATDSSGKTHDTSAEGGGVKGPNIASVGGAAAAGAAAGASFGPYGAAAGAAIGAGGALIGNAKAQKEYAKNLLADGEKKTYLERKKLDSEYEIEQGKQQLADIKAIRERQLGIS